MYLKEIKAHGFKSFADTITIDLTSGITGVVGPNGSGKSNVVDAVRWVLGEQSVKSLRGDGAMSDVIFSGSKSRKALNVASVTLTFDNKDQYLPTPFSEVSIKRRVFRDGTNEYFINESQVRLKDIVDLFLDSGIAKESFNIISQGKIDEIISTKPADRRVIFEEAAGVLKYKKRKFEALRKLERTEENLKRASDVMDELEVTKEPLRAQKEKALAYKKISSELEELEISILALDIRTINEGYQINKKKIEELNEEIVKLSSESSTGESKITQYKYQLDELNKQITMQQQALLQLTKEVEKINSQKQIILERKKYHVEDAKMHQNVIDLKERQLSIENEIASFTQQININKNEKTEKDGQLQELDQLIQKQKQLRIGTEGVLSKTIRENHNVRMKIDSLKESIENNSSLPSSVRAVLNHPKLTGIHHALGNLIEVEEAYQTALSVALGASSSYVIVDDENVAKEAISYLKNNHLGRTTFLPLSNMRPKGIDPETRDILKREKGYVGTADELASYQSDYRTIVSNQLGTTLIVDNIDHANYISKKIQRRYRIVTLDGEMIHVGGMMTGGSLKIRNVMSEKAELEIMIKQESLLIDQMKELENKLNEIDYGLRSYEDKYYLLHKEQIRLQEWLLQKQNEIAVSKEKLEEVKSAFHSTNHLLQNTISKEEDEVLEKYYETLKKKEEVEQALAVYQKQKENIIVTLEEVEYSVKKDNGVFYQKNNDLKRLEIEVNRMDVKLDTLLQSLSETYNLTYEAASSYVLALPIEEGRSRLTELKQKIKALGEVNLGAPEEYDRLQERYEYLNKGKTDLENAKATLLDIIKEMDGVMEEEFSKTFALINENFEKTFQELFKGGNAFLKLTDPDNLLETGIEIVASPPGKKLSSISLLSGGEKTFTAISLLFAILKTRPVPFCILDEVEAALDEVNVDSFGEYLLTLKEKTQFILITHKKKTMEFVDNLYGITMQESGVSKLVSVRLEEIKN